MSDSQPSDATYEAAEAAEEKPQTISDDYQSLFPPISKETFDELRAATPEHVEKYDKIVREGMHAFFNNEFDKAESLFRDSYQHDPFCANAWGTLGSIRALLSFERDDIELASNQLIYSAAFGNGVQPNQGMIKSLSNWWNRKTTPLTPYQFRALVVVGESELLRANVLLVQDTMTGYLKAGFALRRGYNIYDRLLKYLKEFDGQHGVDANSIGGVHFGVGAIHVVTSILPPKILTILKALGYMHDRDVGMHHLQECLRSRTIRSPIASLFLLAFHGILPSFAPLTMARNVPLAEQVIQETLTVYPKSMIHLWLSGRVERLKKNTNTAIKIFRDCVDHGATLRHALPQLEHFALYDLAWAYMSKLDWLSAFDCFVRLEIESAWSKMFYSYAQGACLDMLCVDAAVEDEEARRLVLSPTAPPEQDEVAATVAKGIPFNGNSDEDAKSRRDTLTALSPAMRVKVCRIAARKCYQRSAGSLSFKVGGKIISVEQFAKRRIKHTFGINRSPLQQELQDKGPRSYSPEDSRQMASGDDADFVPADALAQDDKPLRLFTGLELAGHFNVFVQTEDSDVKRLLAYVRFYEVSTMPRADYEDNAVVMITKANLERSLKLKSCEAIYDDLLAAPPLENEKWIQPYALYNKGVWQYEKGEVEESKETLSNGMRKRFGGKDYNFEMQMGFRLHLTQDMFKRDDEAAKAASAVSGA